jgi:hypothetical protein
MAVVTAETPSAGRVTHRGSRCCAPESREHHSCLTPRAILEMAKCGLEQRVRCPLLSAPPWAHFSRKLADMHVYSYMADNLWESNKD